MAGTIKIRKGVDIKLKGVADKVLNSASYDTVAIKPTDFHGVTPKLLVKEGAEVKAGTPLFFDKYHEQVKFCSPVSGEVAAIVRGDKRKILEVKILADKETRYESFSASVDSKEHVTNTLCEAGLWPFIKRRPYDVIAKPDETPKAIFISAFDTNPLAADYDFALHGMESEFQAGIDAISKLTSGKVHLNVHSERTTSSLFKSAKGVVINEFAGPHPSGNVGVQMHHVDPINKGEIAWAIDPFAVVAIGRLFKTNKLDLSRSIAVAGSMVKKPRYEKTVIGASIKGMLSGNLEEGGKRVISGNALTGDSISEEGYLGFYSNCITVIPEGDHHQFLGWIAPNFDKFSLSRTFFSWLQPNKRYDLDTNMNGEPRAFVVTGQYEKVFPMDIYPQQLVKATMIEDIEQMEGLGIFEVAPEDFALAEYSCASKMPLQQIMREGLDLVQKEVG